MDYYTYQKSRNAAWHILLDAGIDRLPVDLKKICRHLRISVKCYDQDADGSSQIINGSPVIIIRNGLCRPRARFTIAHEIGHILLGHVGMYRLVNREPSPSDNPIEQAANAFAARLLAPSCVLWALEVHTHEQIMRLCDISQAAAEYRMERMNLLYKRNRFLTSDLERQVFRNFQAYIRETRDIL